MEKPFSLFSSARAVVCRKLWGICREKGENLIAQHREKIENKLCDLNLPTALTVTIKGGLSLLEIAYNEASDWLTIYEPKIQSLIHNELDVFTDSKYRFSNFITPLGTFDDEKWVSLFVEDQQQRSFDRFSFACFYCLEEKIQPLWQETKAKGFDGCRNYFAVKSVEPTLFSFWNPYLDFNLNEPIPALTFEAIYYGFRMAIRNGHEQAVSYFWSKFSEQWRSALRSDIILFDNIMWEAEHKNYRKILHFLYSQLNAREQLQLLQLHFQRREDDCIWYYYLNPILISFIPDQVTLYQNALPEAAFKKLITQLVFKMSLVKNPVYQRIFQTVWKIGSKRNKSHFFKNDSVALLRLLKSKDFTCSHIILKDASFEEKKLILWETADELLLKTASFQNDPSAVCNCLFLFLTDLQQDNAIPRPTPFYVESLNFLIKIRDKLQAARNLNANNYKDDIIIFMEILIFEMENFFNLKTN